MRFARRVFDGWSGANASRSHRGCASERAEQSNTWAWRRLLPIHPSTHPSIRPSVPFRSVYQCRAVTDPHFPFPRSLSHFGTIPSPSPLSPLILIRSLSLSIQLQHSTVTFYCFPFFKNFKYLFRFLCLGTDGHMGFLYREKKNGVWCPSFLYKK